MGVLVAIVTATRFCTNGEDVYLGVSLRSAGEASLESEKFMTSL